MHLGLHFIHGDLFALLLAKASNVRNGNEAVWRVGRVTAISVMAIRNYVLREKIVGVIGAQDCQGLGARFHLQLARLLTLLPFRILHLPNNGNQPLMAVAHL